MDFWGALRVLRRRWYIAVPSALLAVGLAAGVFLSIPTRYESTGVMVLTSPSAGGTFSENVSPEEAVKVNPLLAFDGSLSTTSQIIAQILADPKTREQMGISKDSTSNFTAAGGGVNGPFLFVVTDAESADEAERLVTTVLDFARTELEGQQRKLNAPESTFITSQVLVSPTTAEAQIGGKVRYAGAAFVLMMLLTLAATFASDSVLGQLRRRREGAGDGARGEAEQAEQHAADAEPADPRQPDARQAESRQADPRQPEARHAGPRQAGGRPVEGRPEGRPAELRSADVRSPAPRPTEVNGATPNGVPRRPDVPPHGTPAQRPAPPVRRVPTASEQTMKVQPTAGEKTVKIAAVNLPDPHGPTPGGPAWPTREDKP